MLTQVETKKRSEKLNPAYGRERISWPMEIVALFSPKKNCDRKKNMKI